MSGFTRREARTMTKRTNVYRSYVVIGNPVAGWDLWFVSARPLKCRLVATFTSRDSAWKTKNSLMRSRANEGPQYVFR